VPPRIPACSIGWLVRLPLSAWIFKFLYYDVPELWQSALDFFGERPDN